MYLILYFTIFVVFTITFTLEVIAPASGANCDRRWLIYAGVLNVVQIGFTLVAGLIFHEWFVAHSVFSLPKTMPAPLQGVVCFLLASFVAYWWHRAMHKFDLLWRVFHQLHHSPARIEALTAFYMHPFDGMAATLITSFCAYFILGLSSVSAAWAVLFAALYNLFIHADKRTPRWLGVILARPEMHRVHHEYGLHEKNYGLPIWDLLFGSWSNPKERILRCGFESQKESKIIDMLLMKDVHKQSDL